MNFRNYINSLRIEDAKRCWKPTRAQASSICAVLRFQQQIHIQRGLFQAYGHQSSEWRRGNRDD